MADITLGSLIALVYADLAETLQQTREQSDLVRLQVSDIDLELPAHLRLPADPPSPEAPARLLVTLPSTRETPAPGRLGRVRITFERTPPQSDSEEPQP